MRIVVQRVKEASVRIATEGSGTAPAYSQQAEGGMALNAGTATAYSRKRSIGQGYLILLGVCEEDTEEDVDWLVRKVVGLRVFDDENHVMNRSIMETDGECLVVSQFTLFASYKKGNRPSWLRAARHEISVPLYELFCRRLSEALGKPVATGEFGADMQVSLVNDGPVTICMDTKNKE